MTEGPDPARIKSDFGVERLVVTDPLTLQGKAIPERRWLWRDWVPIGHTTALYGDGGTGKSLLAQELMSACALGLPFLGQSVMRCKVLGAFCEDDSDELHRRQSAINRAFGVDFGDLERMRWISRVGRDNLLMTFAADGRGEQTPFALQLFEEAKETGVQLLVVDTAADVFGGNEIIRPQVRQFIGMLTGWAQAINGAVVLLAHPSQTGKNTGSGDGGSTAWSNSVRSRLYLTRPDAVNGEQPDADKRTLSRMKSNYAAIGGMLNLRYDDGAFVNEDAQGLIDGYSSSQTARNVEIESGFLEGLAELAGKNMRCNVHKGQANYAPRALREKTARCAVYSEDELALAMNRLIVGSRIESIEEGPPSRRRSFLQAIAPNLPGVS